jgi:hypothetical protein
MRAGHRLSLISAFAVISTCASAQTPPWPTCMPEFGKMRGDVENRFIAIKAASKRYPTWEEMCGHITGLAAAEAELVKYTESNAGSCGIPPEVTRQLKATQLREEQIREKVCAAATSLSDVPGRSLVPIPERTKSGPGNTLD